MSMRALPPLVLALLATCLDPAAARAQEHDPPRSGRWAAYWGVNVSAAMISAWLQSRGQGAGIGRIIVAGLAGGSTMYAGQQVVGTRNPRSRLAGLELTAVGASITRNIARSEPPLAQLTLPVFPFYLRVRTRPALAVQVRLSAVALLSTARLAATYRRAPDLGRSLSSGAPVFAVPAERLQCTVFSGDGCVEELAGQHLFGAVAYAVRGTSCLGHEFGHVAQDVRDALLFAVPASDYALARTGSIGSWAAKYIVLDAALPLMLLNNAVGARSGACTTGPLYECEVDWLTRPHR